MEVYDYKQQIITDLYNKDNNNILFYSFIIVKYVTNKTTNLYWQYNYKKIRQYYPNNKIIIIDDNSPYINNDNFETNNCKFIKSEYPQRGELLGYYYFHKLKPSKYAIILHDSVFFNKYINLECDKYKFIWTFNNKYNFFFNNKDNSNEIINILNKLKKKELLNLFNENKWTGCYGAMSIINWDFLNFINNDINLFNVLLNEIKNRQTRMILERIIGIIFQNYNNKKSETLFGYIHKYCLWKLKFNRIKMKYDTFMKHLPLVKVWTGR